MGENLFYPIYLVFRILHKTLGAGLDHGRIRPGSVLLAISFGGGNYGIFAYKVRYSYTITIKSEKFYNCNFSSPWDPEKVSHEKKGEAELLLKLTKVSPKDVESFES